MAMMLGDDETNNSMSELSFTPAMDDYSFPPPILNNDSAQASMIYGFQGQMLQAPVVLPEDYLPAMPYNSEPFLPVINNASMPLPIVAFYPSVEPQGFDEDEYLASMNSLDESAPGVVPSPLSNVMPETFGDIWDEYDIPPFNDYMSMLTLPYAPMPDNSLLPIINNASTPLPVVAPVVLPQHYLPAMPYNSLLPIINNASMPLPIGAFYTYEDEEWASMNSLYESAPSVVPSPLSNVMPETFGDMWDEDDIQPLSFNDPM